MDIKLNFIKKGKGEPLILLHGNGENSNYFINQINYFAKTYCVIAVDTRGHGESARGTASFTLHQFADDLKNLLDYLNIKKTNILGFSDGGNIAILFTLKYPEYVNKLILNGANLFPKGVKRIVQIPIIFGYHLVSFISHIDSKAIKNKEMLNLMVKQPDIKPNELNAIKCPTLLIVGKNDLIKLSHSKLLAKNIPQSEFCVIKGNHFIANKNPSEFNTSVAKFLSKNNS